ncbi:response regulator [Roseovarius sp. E0-M6]|uniref:response regulator n=1 Tax=Roseovarius sp. E0-M6 TaxID=3127118 RepID=UPI00300FB16B
MKLLVVDDEPLFLELMSKYLGSLGYADVRTCTTAQAALDAIASETSPFDCCLLDIKMPGMDGIELCGRIRAHPEYAVTPIVMITAMTEKSYVDEAFRAGANDYVNKPIDRVELEARMGMVENLVAERVNSSMLLRQLGDASRGPQAKVDFAAPILLEEVDGVIALSSMENYLLRLGKLHLYSNATVGIHIKNVERIFAETGGAEFMDILGEVAQAISDVLHDCESLLSYAGKGDFCCIRSRTRNADPEELALQINDRIARGLNALLGDDVSLPLVSIGKAQMPRLVHFGDATDLIYRAIDDARAASNPTSAPARGTMPAKRHAS